MVGRAPAPISSGWRRTAPTAARRSCCTTGRRTRTATCTWGISSTACSRTRWSRSTCSTAAMPTSSPAGTCTACRSSARRSSTSKLDFRQADPLELRRACRERALYWLNHQREKMLRMGVGFGRYDDPYMTIAPQFEATIVETLADLAESDYLYKGLRSTLWCIYDETALAEAEIEYKDHTSPSDLRPLPRERRAAQGAAREIRAGRRRDAAVVRHLDDDAVDAARQRRDRAQARRAVRRVSCRRRRRDRRGSAGIAGSRAHRAKARARCARRSKAARSNGSRYGIRSSTATP